MKNGISKAPSRTPTNGHVDVTKLALRTSELRYRRLFESAQDGILILDGETGEIIDANPFLVELGNAHGLPAIALSGYGMEQDRERSRKSGFFIHLTKPIDIHTLEDAIAAAPQTRSAL